MHMMPFAAVFCDALSDITGRFQDETKYRQYHGFSTFYNTSYKINYMLPHTECHKSQQFVFIPQYTLYNWGATIILPLCTFLFFCMYSGHFGVPHYLLHFYIKGKAHVFSSHFKFEIKIILYSEDVSEKIIELLENFSYIK